MCQCLFVRLCLISNVTTVSLHTNNNFLHLLLQHLFLYLLLFQFVWVRLCAHASALLSLVLPATFRNKFLSFASLLWGCMLYIFRLLVFPHVSSFTVSIHYRLFCMHEFAFTTLTSSFRTIIARSLFTLSLSQKNLLISIDFLSVALEFIFIKREETLRFHHPNNWT